MRGGFGAVGEATHAKLAVQSCEKGKVEAGGGKGKGTAPHHVLGTTSHMSDAIWDTNIIPLQSWKKKKKKNKTKAPLLRSNERRLRNMFLL